jgi:uncharacterized membrane protein YeaQ/YmgE (transglycosylase-associated protein family)
VYFAELRNQDMGFIWSLLIGALAGYLANHFMGREKSSVLRNILLGVAGALIGNWVLGLLVDASPSDSLGRLLSATGGAMLLIYIVRAVRK